MKNKGYLLHELTLFEEEMHMNNFFISLISVIREMSPYQILSCISLVLKCIESLIKITTALSDKKVKVDVTINDSKVYVPTKPPEIPAQEYEDEKKQAIPPSIGSPVADK